MALGLHSGPTRRSMRQVLGAVAEFEKNVLVMKLRAAREHVRKRQGRCEGRRPCGAHPNEQVVLQRMRQLRRKAPKGRRLSLTNVAAALNADGHRNRSGREVVTADGVSRPHELTSQERHRHGRVVTSVVEPKKEGHGHRRSEGAMVEETSSRWCLRRSLLIKPPFSARGARRSSAARPRRIP